MVGQLDNEGDFKTGRSQSLCSLLGICFSVGQDSLVKTDYRFVLLDVAVLVWLFSYSFIFLF